MSPQVILALDAHGARLRRAHREAQPLRVPACTRPARRAQWRKLGTARAMEALTGAAHRTHGRLWEIVVEQGISWENKGSAYCFSTSAMKSVTAPTSREAIRARPAAATARA